MSEIERESLEVDVLFVGAGPANLASAYHPGHGHGDMSGPGGEHNDLVDRFRFRKADRRGEG